MSSQTSFGSSMLFQNINDDLNASLATADELSREFNSLLKEASSNNNTQTSSEVSPEKPKRVSSGSSNGSSSSKTLSPSSTTSRPLDSVFSSSKSASPPVFYTSPVSSPKIQRAHSPLPRAGSDSYSYGQQGPRMAPNSPRHNSPSQYDRSPRSSTSYMERGSSPSVMAGPASPFTSSSKLLSPYDGSQMGHRSPRGERSRSPVSSNYPMSSTLPRNVGVRQPEEGVHRQKNSGKWSETDLDVSYDKKPHHTYDKTEWLQPSVPNSSWRESNLDGPLPAQGPKKDPRSQNLKFSHASLPRNIRITVPPDVSSPVHSPYQPQPIISRISIPPTSSPSRQRKPIPLSVIMRLQNPRWGGRPVPNPRLMGGDGDMAPYPPTVPFPREFFHQLVPPSLQYPPELRQPAVYSDVLNSGDIDAELERLDLVHHMPVIQETPSTPEGSSEGMAPAPRPLSPTRMQPVVAQSEQIPNLEELLRIRAEIPRALKRRGSQDTSKPLKSASHYQPNQYKNLIDKLFRKKARRQKGEKGSETSSSEEEEDFATPPAHLPAATMQQDFRLYHSILRRPKHKSSGRRARLSPLVLLLDGSLVGELETVQKAVQEMSDPSQPNDEGITALHNAICGGHYNVVDFLVRIGANVSAPDSHGWTPLHCAASCNDRPLCEFLVRNGAAVMAMTESDGATSSQKCDPYAVGYEECETFLRGVEEAMGTENSGVLYALWSYPAQLADELSFKEADMVTILQRPEGSDWWWASLCGREGFVPNNYFGLFPKVRPKSLC
ncbi:relA-associated inhibitor isoform X1 [Trematomus bernacchii]|uniref:relA-associated inhibitor isoform X1 n=1 Tax=Trematomus bernacchii TaxID=40690 RepID=UPI00146A57C4|nr:relA-associated inhibitor isoform X1 [Trematomus bernacchii]